EDFSHDSEQIRAVLDREGGQKRPSACGGIDPLRGDVLIRAVVNTIQRIGRNGAQNEKVSPPCVASLDGCRAQAGKNRLNGKLLRSAQLRAPRVPIPNRPSRIRRRGRAALTSNARPNTHCGKVRNTLEPSMLDFWNDWIDAAALALEAQGVVAMRLVKITAGGPAADPECQLMVAEKFAAYA